MRASTCSIWWLQCAIRGPVSWPRQPSTSTCPLSTSRCGGSRRAPKPSPPQSLMEIGGWPAGPRRVDRLLIEGIEAVGGTIYRSHGVGYLLRRDSYAVNHTWQVDDDYFLAQAVDQRPGLDLQFAGVVA